MSQPTYRGSFKVVVDPALQRCQVTFSGPIDLSAVILAGSAMISDPLFDPTFDFLVDSREVDFDNRNVQAMRVSMGEIVSKDLPFVPPSRAAFVVSTMLVKGYVGMYRSMRPEADQPTATFDDLDEAIAWLTSARQALRE